MKNIYKKSAGKRFALAMSLGVGIYLFTFGIIAVMVCGSMGLFPTSKSKRQKLVDYFSNDGNYTVLHGRANILYGYENDGFFSIELTLKEVPSENTDNYTYIAGKTYVYRFVQTNRKVLEDNEISQIYGETTERNELIFYAVDQPVTITVCEEHSHGAYPFAVALSIDEKEYLPYETGKTNMINYLRYEMH